jgi:hypothetical protein
MMMDATIPMLTSYAVNIVSVLVGLCVVRIVANWLDDPSGHSRWETGSTYPDSTVSGLQR